MLMLSLPHKQEHVILIRMSEVQKRLYTEFMDSLNGQASHWSSNNPLKAFAVCCKVTIIILCRRITRHLLIKANCNYIKLFILVS